MMGMQKAIPKSRCIKVTCPGFRFFERAIAVSIPKGFQSEG
jgi:hypothetical protein